MKKIWLGMAGAAVTVFVAGCMPELAQVNAGSDEQEWKEFAATGYSGYRPPRVSSPAEKDKYQNMVNTTGAAADPVAAAEDPAESAPAVVEIDEETPAVSAEQAQGANEQLNAEEPEAETAQPAPEKAPEAAVEAPAADAPVSGEEYIVKPGDTLSGIAKRFYKDGNLSDIIFKANSKTLKTPHAIRPGMKLIIPKM